MSKSVEKFIGSVDIHHGLSEKEIETSRRVFGKNSILVRKTSIWRILIRQFNNPLLLILVVTTIAAYSFGDHIDALIILVIIALSISLGFYNEFFGEKTVDDLLKKVALKTIVIRNGTKQDILSSEIAVGDIVLLHQGSKVPADIRLLETNNLSIDESALTGESLPVYKKIHEGAAGRAQMGTVVMTGTTKAVVEAVGNDTHFAVIAKASSKIKPKTDFQKGLSNLIKLITKVILVMAALVCVVNIALGRPPLEAILFSLSIAIGLTPALLPVILTIGLSHGARKMAQRSVIVKELISIENLGNMDILCTDKTGTLTEGKIHVDGVYDMENNESENVLELALWSDTVSVHHRIVGNPIEVAVWEYGREKHITLPDAYKKFFSAEFDYEQKANFTVIGRSNKRMLVYKGSVTSTLKKSTYIMLGNKKQRLAPHVKKLQRQFEKLNQDGLRVLLIAQTNIGDKERYSFGDATNMTIWGYVTVADRARESAREAINDLEALGVAVKIITGDNAAVTHKIAHDVDFEIKAALTGQEIAKLSSLELQKRVVDTTIFSEVLPEQKLAIIQALQKAGKVVGFMGDGINDVSALHVADVGISVDSAVDVAKDTATIVLLRKSLNVLAEGIQLGRATFANTMKYILMGTSSNFGNMFSMAGASFIFTSFLPMTPSQILLNNLLYDTSQLAIPGDNVDKEILARPNKWNIKGIYRAMLFFGPISSVFDFTIFAILWFGFAAKGAEFQTGWFLESIFTQVLVVFVIRTIRPLTKSRPAKALIFSCFAVLFMAFMLPFSPLAPYLNFAHLPIGFYGVLIILTVIYLTIINLVKRKVLTRIYFQAKH